MAQQYRLLSLSDKTSWINLAASIPLSNSLHVTYYRNAIQQFVFNNSHLLKIGVPLMTTAPDVSHNVFPTDFNYNVAYRLILGVQYLTIEIFTTSGISYQFKLFSTGVVSKGLKNGNSWKFILYVPTPIGPGSVTSIQIDYLSVYPVLPVAGQQVFFKGYMVDTLSGFRSPNYLFTFLP